MNGIAPPRFARLSAVPILALALTCLYAPAPAATTHPLPLWRVSDSHGHVLYLAGSMHALKTDDYPLPAPFATTFERCRRLVEELDLAAISPQEVKKAVKTLGLLPADQTLAGVMGANWVQAQTLAETAGIDLASYQRLKPWLAAIRIAGLGFIGAGYVPALGLDRHFSKLAAARKMPVTGLETLTRQMGFFNTMKPALQRQFLLQSLSETPHYKTELARLHTAWKHGDMATLAAIADEDFAPYPELRHRVLGERNRRWLPVLERCLAEGRGCFVVVGAEHMIGPNGLVALLDKAGNRVHQLRTAPTPAAAGAPLPGT